MFLKNYFLRRKYRLPKFIWNVWYNRSVHSREYQFPHVFDEKHKYIKCKKGLLVKMFIVVSGENTTKYAWYEVIGMSYSPGLDFIYDCDADNCDLKFHHIK